MLELNARREAIKQKIREKLQDLSNEEKELNEEMDRLCSSVAEFRERLEMIKGGVSTMQLKKIATEIHVNVDVYFPFTQLARRMIYEELERRIKEAELKISEVRRRMKEIENKRRDVNICPDCGGQGFRASTCYYVREDDIIIPVTSYDECPLCGGKGRIEL